MRTIGTVLLLVLAVAVGLSQTPVREGFTYPLTTLAGLGTATNGFGGPWVSNETGGVEGLVTVAGTRFAYGDLSWTVPHDTVHIQWTKSNAWADHNRYKRPLAAAWANTTGNKYWLSYLLDVKEPLPVGNTYFMVKLYSGNTEILALGKGGGRDANPPVWTCGSGWPGASGDDVSAVQITAGPVWLVMRIDMSGNGTDPCRTYMWVDPNPAGTEPDTSAAIVKRNSTVPGGGIDNIALEFGGDGPNVRLVFDEISLASSFGDLTAATPVGTVARESFTYPQTGLAGLGTATNGFGGPWANNETGGVDGLIAVAGTRFSYADLSWTLPYDTTHVQVLKSNAWADHNRYKRPLAAAWPNTVGNKYWVSYMVDVKDSIPVGNTYFMLKLYSGNTEILALGKGGGRDANPPVWTCGSGWPGASGDDVSAVPITAGPVWLVMRIDMSGNGTDPCRTYMWLDPNPAGTDPDTSAAIVKRNSTVPAGGIDNIALEFGGDGINGRLIFDEIRMAVSFAGLSTAVSVPRDEDVPVQFGLAQNYPNPFNPSTTISYTLERTEHVRISVYDLLGREIAVLVNGVQNPGYHDVAFQSSGLTSGAYFYRMQTAQGAITKKMVLMK
jgi:hypothetical protein